MVDDEEIVLRFVSGFLADAGYNVLTASSGENALRQSRDYKGEIHLLLSDFRMPGMTGIELATEISCEQPQIHVLLMSGFPTGMLVLNEGWHFLPKPFVPSKLRVMISGILNSPEKNA